ncbi:MAG: polysaccharide deacetylase [Acidaminococcales bacterium]|jgi:peptidoglycan/xylan/chitin deacetylase (PgdA/CDA1 family)|nr:polysaccharide deacetylase [Acidaminococcales bacterium]
MITFNFAAETLWLSRNPTNAANFAALSRGQYGPTQGLPRILAMMAVYGVKGTFFTPGWVAEKYAALLKDIHAQGHEIAYHGYLHEETLGISYEEEAANMEKSEKIIERIIGKKPVGHRAPNETMHPFTLEMIHKRGYLYSSNLSDCDKAYLHTLDGKAISLVELPIDTICDDNYYYFFALNPPVRRGISSSGTMIGIWKDEFAGLAEEGDKVLSLVIHPQLSGRTSRINALGEFIGYMKSRGAWIAKSEEVARYILSQKHGRRAKGI